MARRIGFSRLQKFFPKVASTKSSAGYSLIKSTRSWLIAGKKKGELKQKVKYEAQDADMHAYTSS